MTTPATNNTNTDNNDNVSSITFELDMEDGEIPTQIEIDLRAKIEQLNSDKRNNGYIIRELNVQFEHNMYNLRIEKITETLNKSTYAELNTIIEKILVNRNNNLKLAKNINLLTEELRVFRRAKLVAARDARSKKNKAERAERIAIIKAKKESILARKLKSCKKTKKVVDQTNDTQDVDINSD